MDYYSLLKSLVFVVTDNNFFQYLPKLLPVSLDVPCF